MMNNEEKFFNRFSDSFAHSLDAMDSLIFDQFVDEPFYGYNQRVD